MTTSSRFKYGWLPAGLAVVAAVLLGTCGPGVRAGFWDYRVGFELLRWSAYIGIAAVVIAIALLVLPKTRRGWRAAHIAALVVGLAVVAVPARWIVQARSVPPIHDITTDTDNPPQFAAILARRAKAANTADYGGKDVADAQHRAFPDIQPLVLAVPPAQAFEKALDAARQMGWEIVDDDSTKGRIEATATTTFFAFKDDIVIRITAEGSGSRIDVRSVSRVGRSDLGTNAKRVRAYLAMLGR